jgi:hypothetical protein
MACRRHLRARLPRTPLPRTRVKSVLEDAAFVHGFTTASRLWGEQGLHDLLDGTVEDRDVSLAWVQA